MPFKKYFVSELAVAEGLIVPTEFGLPAFDGDVGRALAGGERDFEGIGRIFERCLRTWRVLSLGVVSGVVVGRSAGFEVVCHI